MAVDSTDGKAGARIKTEGWPSSQENQISGNRDL
jgi:hypothetical protein